MNEATNSSIPLNVLFDSKGSWIPPLNDSQTKYKEFETAIDSKSIINGIDYANAIASFVNSLKYTSPELKIPEPSARVEKILRAKPSIALDGDSFSRVFLDCCQIQHRLKQESPTPQKYVNLHVGKFKIYNGKVLQPKNKRSFSFGSPDDETLAQNKNADAFLFYIAKIHAPKFVISFRVWDILMFSFSEFLYQTKKSFGYKRPIWNAGPIKPPLHSTWPGGHAFSAGALATVLYWTLKHRVKSASQLKMDLEKAATRIAQIREYAGLHWKEDSLDGLLIGSMAVRGIIEDHGMKGGKSDLIQFLRIARKL